MTEAIDLVDTHAHLQDEAFRDSLVGVLARARSEGVSQVIAIGTTAADSAEVVELARLHPGVFAAVGVQPNHVADANPADWERVVALSTAPGVVAIGETGLDRYWKTTPLEAQQDWFDRHLDLAENLGLPVVIHCRDCAGDIVSQLGRRGRSIRGVLHSFTGDWDDAEAFLELGLHVSFAGMVTFANKKLDPLREAAARVPLNRLLVETDSPYLSPHPHRGQTNEPARVAFTARRIAEERGMAFADLARQVARNARALFGLPELT
jgi:TatD DNase family protein